MKVYFVRHGKTNSNKLGRVMSRSNDEPLSEEGLLEVQKVVSEKMNELDFDIVFSSPLKRAAETAHEFAKSKNLAAMHHHDLIELEFGKLSNKTWDEIDVITNGELNYSIWKNLKGFDFTAYDGESHASALERMKNFITYLKTNHPNSKPLVVTHGGVLRTLNGLYPEYVTDGFKNVSVHVFEV